MRYGQLPHQRDRPGDYDDSDYDDSPAARPRDGDARPRDGLAWPRDGRRPAPDAFPPASSAPASSAPARSALARSALGLRRILALFGLVVCGVAGAWFAVVDWPVPAALLALLALVAVVDLAVIQFRIRQLSRGRRR